MIIALVTLTSISFFYYGLTCIFSRKMVAEFKRFGLSDQQRVMTGILQLLGAIGLSLGFIFPIVGMSAAAGLTLLMLLGFGTRIKVRDSVQQSLPSFIFMVINGYIFFNFYVRII